jgi:hypothetical protein
MSSKYGQLASLGLLCLTTFGVFYGAFDALEYLSLMVFGTVSGLYFVYQEWKGN